MKYKYDFAISSVSPDIRILFDLKVALPTNTVFFPETGRKIAKNKFTFGALLVLIPLFSIFAVLLLFFLYHTLVRGLFFPGYHWIQRSLLCLIGFAVPIFLFQSHFKKVMIQFRKANERFGIIFHPGLIIHRSKLTRAVVIPLDAIISTNIIHIKEGFYIVHFFLKPGLLYTVGSEQFPGMSVEMLRNQLSECVISEVLLETGN